MGTPGWFDLSGERELVGDKEDAELLQLTLQEEADLKIDRIGEMFH